MERHTRGINVGITRVFDDGMQLSTNAFNSDSGDLTVGVSGAGARYGLVIDRVSSASASSLVLEADELVNERLQSFERAINKVENEARLRDRIILEGPPIYLWPRLDMPAQNIASVQSANGWILSNAISGRLSGRHLENYMLLDDFNNRPQGTTDLDINATFRDRVQAEPVLRGLSILDTSAAQVVSKESDFLSDDESRNKCQFLDASFQMQKLLGAVEEGLSPAELAARLRATLIVVVHPEEFKFQQSLMLAALMGAMKDSPFSGIPKVERRQLLSQMYTHVWIDSSGKVESVTKPVWNGNSFDFSETAYAN